MTRRAFFSHLLLGVAGVAVGCSRRSDDLPPPSPVASKQPIEIAPFSASRFHERLNELLSALERAGRPVSKSLLPPIPEGELRERCQWFPSQLTQEIVALYGWRGGAAKDKWNTEHPLSFRDCGFAGIDVSRAEYKSIMQTYGAYPGDHELLKNAFPIAEFNGGWLVIPTTGISPDRRFPSPIISVHQGVSVWFYSIERMVETCIEWVSHPKYKGGLPPDEELRIWRNHNPGIFEK